ncbi:MAG: endo-1,4-beta-xylanase [Treponema sp.]|nr:endo-1,4-beta-xylanase [Treponema sp.]
MKIKYLIVLAILLVASALAFLIACEEEPPASSQPLTHCELCSTELEEEDSALFCPNAECIVTIIGLDIIDLPALKETFADYFDIGNIFNPGDVNAGGSAVTTNRLTHHYNVLTAENHMKPSYLSSSATSLNAGGLATADRMVNAALASGFKVVGHTLLWHSQIPSWQADLRTNSTTKETALTQMRNYITSVVTHFGDRIYAWDVLNEAFPDGGLTSDWKTSMRTGTQGNPWFMKIGHEFVYEGFRAARLANPNAILYYNDYNMNMLNKASLVRDMVQDVNNQWLSDPLYDGKLLIQAIGMQSHHNTGITPASIQAAINLFKPLGVTISISELDILSQSWGDYSAATAVTNTGRQNAANLYGQFFTVFLNNSDIIKRVTFWGLNDAQSWRARGEPLIFSGNKVKLSYYKIIQSLQAFTE